MKKSFKFLERIRILNILMLTFAGIINAVGITIFLSPVKLYDSGISGTAMLLSQITPDFMSLSIFLVLLNTPLFLFGLKREGKLFTFYAIYAVIIYSISAWLITDVLPVDVSFASPLAGTDLLLCALFGGLISGMGSGIALRFGGAMDGIEVLGVIFSKTLGISVGTFCMIYNVILYIICGCVIKSWILPLYSIVTYAAALKTVDFIVDGLDRAKGAMIITSCPWDICEALTQEFGSGMTVINAKGGYSNTDKTIIYFVINRFQVTKMRSIVHEIDKMAYITISDVADVFPANRS
ncbi:MAG: YitT family protein [Oscillospiraceae bacterium]|nr:YitT family protein [Oscillospiraceae bacterium]